MVALDCGLLRLQDRIKQVANENGRLLLPSAVASTKGGTRAFSRQSAAA